MGTTRLKLYNDSLTLCGERALTSLSETGKARRVLDQVWDNGGVRYCLEQGQWQFAIRTQQIGEDPDVDLQFGWAYAFDKPTDWVSTIKLCSDERMEQPLLRYLDETDYWRADITPIWVSFVSDDAAYGGDLARWPQTFCDYAAAEFAAKIIHDLTGDRERVERLLGRPGDINGGELARRRLIAKSRAMMTQPQRMAPAGSWVRSRRGMGGGWGPLGDGGNGGSFTG